ncbi:MAG: right-handed parallel beta-helix repeat-containing protein, partial [Planctomycetaceae bacterium]|nr:right-handed parallel beta-helix repeat-containing protein [Planctomycetaceae bacterium]
MIRLRGYLLPPMIAVAFVIFCTAIPMLAQQDGLTVDVSNRAELISAVNSARPGTTVRIAPGEYPGGLSFNTLRGTEANPIIIEAQDPARPPVFVGGGSGLHLRNPAHVHLRGIVLQGATGNGLNIDDGGRPGEPARGIHLDQVQVRDVGPRGNNDGIKLSGVDHFVLENCEVERWGDSGSAIDMVGCHNGEIKGCQFRHRGDIFGNGVQTKGGSADITIHHCRFENAGGRAVNIGGST